MTAPLVVFPFRYRDARTGRWVTARYKAERDEIAARYADWEIVGTGGERRPTGGCFNPGRAQRELPPVESYAWMAPRVVLGAGTAGHWWDTHRHKPANVSDTGQQESH